MTQPESGGSVTKWIEELRGGSSPVHPEVWRRYFTKLAQFVDNGIAKTPGRAVDGEDVASRVLETVCRKVAEGELPDLRGRSDLWNVLLTVAKRKLVNQTRLESRKKRGGGRVLLETDLSVFQSSVFSMDEIADAEPTLDSAIALRDTCNYLIDVVLRDEKTRNVARLKLEGLSKAEIAQQLGVTIRTVERKVNLIRSLWAEEFGIEILGSSDDQDTNR
jgi:DNA-directed RNA polymerase specialized sigma24 family protein